MGNMDIDNIILCNIRGYSISTSKEVKVIYENNGLSKAGRWCR